MKISWTRSVRVTVALTPFLVSFVRDWRRFLFFGGPRPFTPAQHRDRARRLRITMARLGPSFIKGGQVLAQREDIILPIYAKEFKKLQDAVPPFPSRVASAIIKRVLGAEPTEIFDKFDFDPIAAASLGQVHRAIYRGQPVAIKILRPHVQDLVATDLRVVRMLLWVVGLFLDDNLMRSAYAIIDEYDRMIHIEMDFRNEAANAIRFRRNFADDSRVRIPGCVAPLTRREIVVFEWIEGVRPDRPQELTALGVKTDAMIALIIETYVRMAVVHGFIHADPHPGNLLMDAEGRLCILDYGMALEFDEGTRMELLRVVYAVSRKDVEAIVDGFYRLDMVDPDVSRAEIRRAAETLLSIQLEQDLTPRQIAVIAQEIIDTFYKFPLRLPNQLVYLGRASSLVEGLALQYNPRFNGVKEITPVVKKVLAEIAFDPKKPWKDRARDAAFEIWGTARDFGRVVRRMERDELRVRISQADLMELQRFAFAFLQRLLAGIVMATLAIMVAGWLLVEGFLILLPFPALLLVLGVGMLIAVPMKRGKPGKNWFK